jgi:cell division protein FtsB
MSKIKKPKSKLEWFKKNIVIVPVVAAIIAGTFTSVRYVLSLTDTITANQETIIKLQEKNTTSEANIYDLKTRLAAAEATWTMAENLYRQLADTVRDHTYDLKDLAR